jgi:O-methyltransferase involved in polyketide biosynthesis
MERYLELCEETPLCEDAYAEYLPSKERIQEANY